jgi:drug/metabolite transporter (DMT)-like permease
VNPVVAVLLGWAFLDEAITPRLALGGITILAGLLLVYFARVRESTAAIAAGQTVPGTGGPGSIARG